MDFKKAISAWGLGTSGIRRFKVMSKISEDFKRFVISRLIRAVGNVGDGNTVVLTLSEF